MNKFAIAIASSLLLASAASAADLIIEEPIIDTAFADWNGFHAGVFGGYGIGATHWAYPSTGNTISVPMDGALVGLDAGYNHQIGSFVLGVEGDIAWSNIDGDRSCPNVVFECGITIEWLSTLRGRAGIVHEGAMFYATAGVAAGGVRTRLLNLATSTPYNSRYTGLGYTLGAGAEFKVTDTVSIKGEYLYTNLGLHNDLGILDPAAVAIETTPAFHAVRVGLNYNF